MNTTLDCLIPILTVFGAFALGVVFSEIIWRRFFDE